jgi:hypothetical protein
VSRPETVKFERTCGSNHCSYLVVRCDSLLGLEPVSSAIQHILYGYLVLVASVGAFREDCSEMDFISLVVRPTFNIVWDCFGTLKLVVG